MLFAKGRVKAFILVENDTRRLILVSCFSDLVTRHFLSHAMMEFR